MLYEDISKTTHGLQGFHGTQNTVDGCFRDLHELGEMMRLLEQHKASQIKRYLPFHSLCYSSLRCGFYSLPIDQKEVQVIETRVNSNPNPIQFLVPVD